MMCWHKWDVKKTKKRMLFRRLNDVWNVNHTFIVSVILSVLTIALPAVVLNGFGWIGGFLVIILVSLATCVYAGLLAAGVDLLEKTTKLQDKICLKCHLTILDVSKSKKEIKEYYKVKQDKEMDEHALQVARKVGADTVFKDRKEMWERAKSE